MSIQTHLNAKEAHINDVSIYIKNVYMYRREIIIQLNDNYCPF